MSRIDPPLVGTEIEILRGFLAFHRETLQQKTAGLDDAQLAATLAPSTMTLGGMLKHLALVEDWWFGCVLSGSPEVEPWASADLSGDPDWEWHSAVDDSAQELRALHRSAVQASDEIVDRVLAQNGTDPLATLSVRESRLQPGEHFSLRWILVHMIEEYARHNGHADLIRESIDGSVGE